MKIFISYHLADQEKVNKIKNKLDKKGISYYAVPLNADFTGWSNQQISDFILSEMWDCQILLCVVGKETYSRPHVDYELHHSLKGGVGKRLGWIVDLLETRHDSIYEIDYSTFPNRIQDNEEYACLVSNASLFTLIEEHMKIANSKRKDPKQVIDNTRPCMPLSKSKYYKNN